MKFYDGDYVMKKKDHDDIERRVRAFRATSNTSCACDHIRTSVQPV